MSNQITINDLPKGYQSVAELIGLDNAIELSSNFGGKEIYIPIPSRQLLDMERNKVIHNKYQGGVSVDDLATFYNFSAPTIRKIIKNYNPNNEGVKSLLAEDFPKKFTPIIDIIGMDNAVKLTKYMGKTNIYVPNLQVSITMKRNQQIASEYNGFNIVELANKYFLTTIRIRQIIQRYGK